MARLLITAALVAGCSGGPAAQITPAQVTPHSPERFVLSGSRNENSEAFVLAGGDYRLEWKADSKGEQSCAMGPTLWRTDKSALYGPVSNALVKGAQEGTGRVYGVNPGRYYIDASFMSCLSWEVTVVRA